LVATLRFLKAGVALAIAAFLAWQLAPTTPRLFDWLVQFAGFAALMCATLYAVLHGALPEQAGEEARSATLIQARIRGLKARKAAKRGEQRKEGTPQSNESKGITPLPQVRIRVRGRGRGRVRVRF
jgi:hypothetical protein